MALPKLKVRKPKPETASDTESGRSYWAAVKREFKKNRPALVALWVVLLLVLVAVFADFLAYNKPYYAVYEGETYYPLVADYGESLGLYKWEVELVNADWRELELESSLWPPVTYVAAELDDDNMQSVSPGGEQLLADEKFRHYLGTDEMGHDLLAGLIHGTRISLSVGVIAAGVSAILGILLGALAGYFGDTRLKVPRAKLILVGFGVFIGFFYAFIVRQYALSDSLQEGIGSLLFNFGLSLILLIGIPWLLGKAWIVFQRIHWMAHKVFIPVDLMISRLIELMVSIPILLLIITIAAIAKPSLFLVMAIIGLTTWTRIARFTRAELLKVRSLEYVQAAQAQGFPEFRIILRHALPNALAPVFVSIAFGVASAILIESSLSFLNVGVPVETITWGKLLNAARDNTSAWWLAIFPGLAIFITVTCFNLLGKACGMRSTLD